MNTIEATFADDAAHAAVADVANELSPEAKRGWEDWIGGLIPDPSGGGENDGGETVAGAYEFRAGSGRTTNDDYVGYSNPQHKYDTITFSSPFPNNCISVVISTNRSTSKYSTFELLANVNRYGFDITFEREREDGGAENPSASIYGQQKDFTYIAIGN